VSGITLANIIQYVPTKKVNTRKCTIGARILTSDECAKLIFDYKEKKKKKNRRKR